MATQAEHQQPAPKKPRLVFTDLQRRTLQAIFKVSLFAFSFYKLFIGSRKKLICVVLKAKL